MFDNRIPGYEARNINESARVVNDQDNVAKRFEGLGFVPSHGIGKPKERNGAAVLSYHGLEGQCQRLEPGMHCGQRCHYCPGHPR